MKKAMGRYQLPKVSDVMKSPVIALTENHTVFDALSVFNKYHFSTIPIVKEENNYLVGIVSEGDCLKHLAQNLFFDEMSDDNIGLITNRNVWTITREMDIFELEEYFQREGIRHAPVLEDGGRVIGTVSRTDILKHLESFTKEVLQYRHDVKEPLELSMYKDFDTRIEDISEKHKFDSLT